MNPARPAPGTLIARLEDLPDASARAFDFREGAAIFSLILARRGDEVFAYENECPHAGYPLERPDGRVLMQEGRFLVCSAHGASFQVEDGECAGGPCDGDALTPFAIVVRDGEVRAA
ncbi:MAG TPA: Rieske (2Fe-2S) protein [Caulobacterales bacterium]|nr:Rieske (2Fe-2S) protein [Caulobacterales bacterium]